MWQSADSLPLTDEQKNQLESWVQAPSTPQKIVLRARICLLAHEGLPNRRIAEQLKTSRPTVILWRHHFLKGGVAGLEHEPARKISSQRTQDDQIKAIVEATLHTKPEDATHWSSRTLAERFGVSHMTVARIWDSHGLIGLILLHLIHYQLSHLLDGRGGSLTCRLISLSLRDMLVSGVLILQDESLSLAFVFLALLVDLALKLRLLLLQLLLLLHSVTVLLELWLGLLYLLRDWVDH